MNNKAQSIICIILLLLVSCLNGPKKSDDSSGRRVFLDLTLGMSKQDAISQMHSLVKKGELKESEVFTNYNASGEIYEYPFFIRNSDYTSVVSLTFSSNDLLKSVNIEIQDTGKHVSTTYLRKLIEKKYGFPTDSITSYYFDNFKDLYNTYNWKKLDEVEITLERKFLSGYIRKDGNNSNESNTNYFVIKYTDLKLFKLDLIKLFNNTDEKIKEGQKKIENDI